MTETCPEPSVPTDHQLVRRAQAEPIARSESFETLMRRHEPRVLARSRRLLGCTTAAQDVAQEVFLSFFTFLPRYASDRPLSNWLDVVTTNACRRVLRRRRRELPAQDAALPFEPEADWVAPDPLLRAVLEQQLAALPPDTSEAFRLRFCEGQGFAEVARRLGLKESTVKMRLLRAREGLRRATDGVEPHPELFPDSVPQCARREYHAAACVEGPAASEPGFVPPRSPRSGPSAAMRLLYIEDDPVAAEFVARGLSRQGFQVDVAATGAEGLARAQEWQYDVLVLDVMLPDIKGFELLQRLRGAGVEAPALFLSSRGEVTDRLRGFELGADDYLPKPFALSELAARVRVIARRRLAAPADLSLRVGDLVLDLEMRRAERAGRTIELPPKSFALLELLMSRAGRVVTREEMIEKLWGRNAELRSNALDVQINHLRRRVDQPFPRKLIHTKPGVGYLIEERSDA